MSSQYQRSDLVEGLALVVESPIAEVGEPPAVGHGAGSGSGMTVVFDLDDIHETERLSKSVSFDPQFRSPPVIRGRALLMLNF